jgi:hypothetical protein
MRRVLRVPLVVGIMLCATFVAPNVASVSSGTVPTPEPTPQTPDVTASGNPVLPPLKWAGLLGFKELDGEDYQCTAQFITQRVILTAAHCVRDQSSGQYYDVGNTQSFFALQWQNNTSSQVYHPLCKATWPGWVVPLKPGEDAKKPNTLSDDTQKALLQASQWDYAFIYLDADSITGHYDYEHDFGVIWNLGAATGYPGKLVGGAVIQVVRGKIMNITDVPNLLVIAHGNANFTEGSSGGAWVLNFGGDPKDPNSNKIVGLNSFHLPGRNPAASFGPRFTDRFGKLLDFVASGCKPT